MVTVQGQNGKFYPVDLEAMTCPCTGFRTKGRCSHLQTAHDIINDFGKTARWDYMSLFHKEIRRCDVERGVQAGRVIAKISRGGPSAAVDYCKKIIFEECRNLKLYEAYVTNSLPEREQLRWMIRTKKKWELPWMARHFEDWDAGFHGYYKNKDSWDVGKMMERLKVYQDPAEAYEILFFVQRNKDFEQWFWTGLTNRADQDNNEKLKKYLSLAARDELSAGMYKRMVALELGINHWTDEANELHPDAEVGGFYIPNLPNYVFDCHGFRGQQRTIKNWSHIQKAKMTAEFDMRWSGMLYGIYWRFKCYEKFGSMQMYGQDIKWEDVQLDMNFYSHIQEHDSYYYGSFYEKLIEAGRTVPLWKKENPD